MAGCVPINNYSQQHQAIRRNKNNRGGGSKGKVWIEEGRIGYRYLLVCLISEEKHQSTCPWPPCRFDDNKMRAPAEWRREE